jgi:hypothetical protein
MAEIISSTDYSYQIENVERYLRAVAEGREGSVHGLMRQNCEVCGRPREKKRRALFDAKQITRSVFATGARHWPGNSGQEARDMGGELMVSGTPVPLDAPPASTSARSVWYRLGCCPINAADYDQSTHGRVRRRYDAARSW